MLLSIAFALLALLFHHLVVHPLFFHPLAVIPGPYSFALTKWRLALEDWRGTRTRTIHRLHQRYGPVIRVGPKEIHFNSLTALRTIYGAGSNFERTSFYRMFDVYGKQNLFTFESTKNHGDRKKLLANAYSKSSMLSGINAAIIDDKVSDYLELLRINGNEPVDAFHTLHYFSIDVMSHVLYGSRSLDREIGGTSLLTDYSSRTLIDDILNPARRKLFWLGLHMPRFTSWLYSRTGRIESALKPFLPMQRPLTYTGIRTYAKQVFDHYKWVAERDVFEGAPETAIIAQLWKSHSSQKPGGLSDEELASECADHLLAGIDTTADTLMFLFWALSMPENKHMQQKLIGEVTDVPQNFNDHGNPTVAAADKLPYLNAVIKETLRLYAPLPASEPRCMPSDGSTIDGYEIPAGTVVSTAPYSLHRNEHVFPEPLKFKPERWMADYDNANTAADKWFWAFSSGGRMCIGKHLAMAEMTTLVAAVYRRYSTSIAPGFEDYSPGVTSRFEVFFDECMPRVKEHSCMISFELRKETSAGRK